jgi:Spy/CpxP family protein refolding chaperone
MKLKLLMVAAVSMLGICSLHAQSAAASPSLSPGEASPSPSPGEHWRQRLQSFWKALNLTDAQQQQVHQLVDSNKPARKSLMLNLLNARKALQDAIAKNPTDETTIRSLSATVNNAKTELVVQRAKFRSQLVSILTPEQKQQLTQWDQKREARLQKHIDRLNGTNS